ncbi:unnamed protein product, partial [Polarella glacialis]
ARASLLAGIGVMVLLAERRGDKLVISGDTWDIKGVLRGCGGVWEPAGKSWAFPGRRENEVMEALQREKLLVEDRRPSTPPSSSVGRRSKGAKGNQDLVVLGSDGLAVVRTPAPGRKRQRSRTPPRQPAPTPSRLPDVRLNERTVRNRVAALSAAAGGAAAAEAEGALSSGASALEASVVDLDPAEERRARQLLAQLQAAAAEALAATDASAAAAATARAEAALALADVLSAEALEAGGLVREAARLAFCRGCGVDVGAAGAVAALRRTARRAWGRWLRRRAEAAGRAEEAKSASLASATPTQVVEAAAAEGGG